MRTLEELRKEIDKVDAQIVESLNLRASLVKEVGKTKAVDNSKIYSASREKEIIGKVLQLHGSGDFPERALVGVYSLIVSATRSLEGELRVAYYGTSGFERYLSAQASRKQFGELVRFVPETDFAAAVNKIRIEEIDYLVVPVESSDGSLRTSLVRELTHAGVFVIAEIFVRDELRLCVSGGDISLVQEIAGDSSSINKADSWLSRNLPNVVRTIFDSPQEAALYVQNKKSGVACLATNYISEKYDLISVASGLDANSGSSQRFFVLGSHPSDPTDADRTTLVCAISNESGALHRLLEPATKYGLSLDCVYSLPSDSAATGGTLFFLEFQGQKDTWKLVEVELNRNCSSMYILGQYPAATRV